MLQKVQNAMDENEKARELELVKLSVSAAQCSTDGKINEKILNDELRNNLKIESTVKEFTNFYFFSANQNYKIYKDGKVEVNELLPDEYQQVGYIESTGTQYIDTKYFSNSKTAVDIICSYINGNNGQWSNGQIFGSANSQEGVTRLSVDITLKNAIRLSYGESGVIMSNEIEKNKIYNINITRKGMKINDEIVGTESEIDLLNGVQTNSAYLFARHQPVWNAYSGFIGRIYSCKIIEDDKCIKYFIPCYTTGIVNDVDAIQRPVGTVGMYDTVNGQFYVNKGTGTFGYEKQDGTYVTPKN